MNNILQNYAILKTNWIPDNPVETFLPFLLIALNETKPQNVTQEELSSLLLKQLGIRLPISILNNIIDFLYNSNVLTKKNKGCFVINYFEIGQFKLPELKDSVKFETNLKQIKINFEKYCGDEKISDEHFYHILTYFINKYSETLFVNYDDAILEYESDDHPNEEYDFMFVEYVKELMIVDMTLFDFIQNISVGALIQNYILDDTVKNVKVLNEMNLYLDTPVVLRILGFTSEFYKDEYSFMLGQWKNAGAKIKIFDSTYDEIIRLLQSCEKWIESINFDYSKASDLLCFFKFNGKSKYDVIEELENLKNNLNILGIEVFETEQFKTEQFWSETEIFKDEINDIYNEIDTSKNKERNNDKTIEYDSKSLAFIKLLNKNEVSLFKDLKNVFVTTNNCLVNIYKKHSKGDNACPVVKDTIISLSSCCTQQDNNEFFKLKFMTYCNDLYKPSYKNRENYIKLLEQFREDGTLTEEKYILMRNHSLVPETILEITKGNLYDLDEENALAVCTKIETKIASEMVENTEKKYEKKIEQIKEENFKKGEEERQSYESFKYSLFKKDYNQYINLIITIQIILMAIFLATFVISCIPFKEDTNDKIKTLVFIGSIIFGLYEFYSLLSSFISKINCKFNLYNFIIKKKAKKICNKYQIEYTNEIQMQGFKKFE